MKLSSKRKKLSFDFLFVSGPLGYNITGGDQVMMQLASRLSKDGYKVGILLVRKIERHIIFNKALFNLEWVYKQLITIIPVKGLGGPAFLQRGISLYPCIHLT